MLPSGIVNVLVTVNVNGMIRAAGRDPCVLRSYMRLPWDRAQFPLPIIRFNDYMPQAFAGDIGVPFN
ncbi:hypothetical protein JCM14469_15360 [Desulfatiferula olefinivorans]